MDNNKRDSDTDLQRGFEPLRTIFAIVVLLLGFAAAARAQSGPGLLGEDVAHGAMRASVNVTDDDSQGTARRASVESGRTQ